MLSSATYAMPSEFSGKWGMEVYKWKQSVLTLDFQI